MKRICAWMLAVLLCLGLCGCGKSKGVRLAEERIAAIGTVTADSGAAIEAAEAALAALSAKDREKVENAAALPQARAALEQAIAEREAQQRQARLDALRQSLLGTWTYTEDVTELFSQLFDEMIGGALGISGFSFAQYVDKIAMRLNFTLLPNGTYSIGADAEQKAAFSEGLLLPMRAYYRDLLYWMAAQELAGQSVYLDDPFSEEAWIAAVGMRFEDMAAQELGMSLDDYLDQMMLVLQGAVQQMVGGFGEQIGNYAVEEDRLLLSESLKAPVSPARYVTYTLADGALTLTGYSNVPDFGSDYPIAMEFAG